MKKKMNFSKIAKYFCGEYPLNSKKVNISDFVNILGNIDIEGDFMQEYGTKFGAIKKDYENLFNIILTKNGEDKIYKILEYFNLPKSFVEQSVIDFNNSNELFNSTTDFKKSKKKKKIIFKKSNSKMKINNYKFKTKTIKMYIIKIRKEKKYIITNLKGYKKSGFFSNEIDLYKSINKIEKKDIRNITPKYNIGDIVYINNFDIIFSNIGQIKLIRYNKNYNRCEYLINGLSIWYLEEDLQKYETSSKSKKK